MSQQVKSLLWRWAIILVVLIGWTVSIFPYNDQPFLPVFEKLARKHNKYTPELEKLIKDAEARSQRVTPASALLEAAGSRHLDLRAYVPVAELPAATNEQVLAAFAKRQPGLSGPDYLAAFGKEAGERADSTFTQILTEATDILARPPASIEKTLELVADEQGFNLANVVTIPKANNPANRDVIEYVRRQARGKLRLGLDLRGGTEFHVVFDPAELKGIDASKARDQIAEILRNRIDKLGILTPEIRPIGESTISVKVPSIDPRDVEGYRRILLASAKLEFRMVSTKSDAYLSGAEKPPRDVELMTQKVSRPGQPVRRYYVKRRPEAATGEQIVRASEGRNQFGQWEVRMEFNNVGAARFADMTREHVGEQMGIVLDGVLYSAPVIKSVIPGGHVVIEGDFSQDESHQLAVVLGSGNLPASIHIQGEFSTNPSLGLDTIKSSIWAGAAGLLIIAIFMIAYYLRAGIVAISALAANTLIVLGTMPIMDATITLPGIAGMILTIGMSIDANVLIYERMREELAAGKSVPTVVRLGYDKALSVIIDANLTSIFAGLALLQFGSGAIKGFAVTLIIGLIASLFTALFMTRAIFDAMLFFNVLPSLKMFSLWKPGRVYRFLEYRHHAYVVSALLFVLGLATLIYLGRGAMGVDFAGGTQVSYTYKKQVPVGEVGNFAEKLGFQGATAAYKQTAMQATNLLELTLPQNLGSEGSKVEQLTQKLKDQFPAAGFEQGTVSRVEGLVSSAFQKQAFFSMVMAIAMILIYLTFRFEFSFALGAIIATCHDAVIGLGLYLMLGWGDNKISLTVLAAILTLIGYSVNDTVVIFDRIRETIALQKERKLIDTINVAISQTLSRTFLTSSLTFLAVLVLYIFGSGDVHDFALVMLIGIIIGVLSTIYIASPVVLAWEAWRAKRRAAKAAAAVAAPASGN